MTFNIKYRIIIIVIIGLNLSASAQNKQYNDYLDRGINKMKNGLDSANYYFSKAIAISDTGYFIYYLRGQSYIFESNIDKAIEDFTEALNYEKKLGKLYYFLFYCQFQKKDSALAMSNLNKCLTLEPYYLDALIAKISIHMDKGQFKIAKPFIDTAKIRYKENSLFIYYDGLYEYSVNQNTSKAINLFVQSFRLGNQSSELFNALFACYYEEENYNSALLSIEFAIQTQPKEPYFYNNLGVLYSTLGKNKEALKAFNKFQAMGGVLSNDTQNIYNSLKH